jgi:hypothetical protein
VVDVDHPDCWVGWARSAGSVRLPPGRLAAGLNSAAAKRQAIAEVIQSRGCSRRGVAGVIEGGGDAGLDRPLAISEPALWGIPDPVQYRPSPDGLPGLAMAANLLD